MNVFVIAQTDKQWMHSPLNPPDGTRFTQQLCSVVSPTGSLSAVGRSPSRASP